MSRFTHFGALLLFVLASGLCFGQSEPPSAPTPQQAPSAPAPQEAPPAGAPGEPQFPPVSDANFDATSPTKADVQAFLKTSWGYDADRVWEVYSVQKTAAAGVSKVTVLVAEKKAPQQIATLTFFVTPDGKHLIAQDSVLDFGAHPYRTITGFCSSGRMGRREGQRPSSSRWLSSPISSVRTAKRRSRLRKS